LSNPKSFDSRKEFHGISVQAIVDRKKRIPFLALSHEGLSMTQLHLRELASICGYWIIDGDWKKGYYFLGDSAYALHQFLITPYDNAMHSTPKDNFNFFHSSSRIIVECYS
jgi:hypothetical protein